MYLFLSLVAIRICAFHILLSILVIDVNYVLINDLDLRTHCIVAPRCSGFGYYSNKYHAAHLN